MTDQNPPPQEREPDRWDSPHSQPPPEPYGQSGAQRSYDSAPPPPPFDQQSYGQPPAAGQYGAQPDPYGVQPSHQFHGGPVASSQAVSNLKLNHWLSAFFWWIPALIFFLTEKDKNPLLDDHLKEVLNFQITRVIVGAVAIIPVIGTILSILGGIALFVIAIMGALKAPDEFEQGRSYRYPLAIRIIK